jgi:hypothetical protein
MNLTTNKSKYSCPPSALIHPSLFRTIFLLINFFGCWAAVFFKARAADAWPWPALLLATFFALGIVATEALISAYFTEYIAFAIYGFLVGAGINVVIQGLLNRFQGLNWAFQSPIQFSLGTLLLGLLGILIFISHSQQLKNIFTSFVFQKSQSENASILRAFSATVWAITAIISLGLCLSLFTTLRIFSELKTANPLRKPLWFSAGSIIFTFMIVILARKNLFRLGRILLPGIVVGLVWASIIRDLSQGLYLAYPEFPLASEVIEVLLVLNFCYLGIAWLNKAAYDSQ